MAEANPKRRKSLQELIERMENGFDENMLDPLLESIYKEDEKGEPDPEPLPSESKVKFKEKKYAVIKVPGVSSGRNSAMTALGSRIGSTFTAAARARRADQEAGGAEKDNFFYLKKAAAFNFGGDKIARTRGRFSRSPQAYQDPALSRDERFTARVKPFIGADAPQKPKGEGINLGKNVSDAFGKLGQAFDSWYWGKEGLDWEVEEISNETSKITSETVEENNKLQEENNTLQKKLIQVIAKQREEEEASVKEARMEAQSRMTRTSGYSWGRGKQGEGEEDGGGLDIDWKKIKWAKWLRRLKNPVKFMRSLGRLGRMKLFKAKSFLTKGLTGAKGLAAKGLSGAKALGAKAIAGAKGLVAGGAAATAAIVAGAGLAASGIGEGFFQLTKKGGTGEQVRDFFKKKGEDTGGPMGSIYGAIGNVAGFSTEATKVTGNALDAIGAPFRYAIEGIRYPFLNEEDREKQAENLAKFDARIREYTRGWMNRIDFMNVVPDEKGGFGNIYGDDEGQKKMMEKMAEGGVIPEPKFQSFGAPRMMGPVPVMAGEAGPEGIFSLESVMGKEVTDKASSVDNSALAAAPFILGISRKVLETSGAGAEMIKSFYEQEVAPLERMFGVSNFSIRSDVGKGVDQAQKAAPGGVGFNLGGLLGGIGSLLGSFFGGPAMAGTMSSGGFQGATLTGTAAERVGNDPEFLAEVTRVAQKFNIKEGDLLGLMASESGLDPASDNGTHVGLIQFSADSARTVGTTQAALKSMTRAQQMKYVEKYFDYWKLPQGASAGQLYSVVFAPAYASKDNNAVLYSSPSAAYNSNAPLDADGDGNITVGEMGGRIEKKKAEFGIVDSGIRAQPPAQSANPPQLPAAPPVTPASSLGHQHDANPGPFQLVAPPPPVAEPPAPPPGVLPLSVLGEQSKGAQVIPFNIGGVQGYTTKSQGFEGRMVTKTFDQRGRQYPSFQALHTARLQMQ